MTAIELRQSYGGAAMGSPWMFPWGDWAAWCPDALCTCRPPCDLHAALPELCQSSRTSCCPCPSSSSLAAHLPLPRGHSLGATPSNHVHLCGCVCICVCASASASASSRSALRHAAARALRSELPQLEGHIDALLRVVARLEDGKSDAELALRMLRAELHTTNK